MKTQELIAEAIATQNSQIVQLHSVGLERHDISRIKTLKNFATIITGIRRCGKSTLLLQILKKNNDGFLYLNFEDIRLTNFEADDFIRLHREITQRAVKTLYFDEIQIIPQWEIFVHQLLNEQYTVYITGSNASLLSTELGTHLTGRYLAAELFPFSYTEFIAYKKLEHSPESLLQYLETGGMPEFLNTGEPEVLANLLNDILVRDIAVRYAIRDVQGLKSLAVYLMSNVGNLVSARNLTQLFGIKSPSTILEYFSYLKNSYLFDFVPQFSYSLNAQQRNPKKVYTIDNGFIRVASISHSQNTGYKLENLIYIFLRRQGGELFYYKNGGECDFILRKNGEISAYQVCTKIDELTMRREFDGLLSALDFFKLDEGVIVTLNQSDTFKKDGKTIRLVPAHEFCTGK